MSYENKSLIKTFNIIQALSEKPRSASVLAKHLGMNASTLHRFLANLEGMGFTEKLANQEIRLTHRFIQLGVMAKSHFDVEGLAKPYLRKLVDETNESALLSSFHQWHVTYLDKLESSQTVRIVIEPGDGAPSYTVASGKLFLSELPDVQLESFFAKTTFVSKTANTLTTKQALKAEIAHIRDQGYAIDEEEYEVGLKGFAAPIRDSSGEMVAALSVAGVSIRFDEAKTNETIEIVKRYAAEISKELGWRETR